MRRPFPRRPFVLPAPTKKPAYSSASRRSSKDRSPIYFQTTLIAIRL